MLVPAAPPPSCLSATPQCFFSQIGHCLTLILILIAVRTLTQTLTLSLALSLTLCLYVSEKNVPSDKWTVTDLWCCTQFLSATLAFVLPLMPRPLRGYFMVHTLERCVLYVCTKFEADGSIPSKVTRGSKNLEIRSRNQGHTHLGVVLSSVRKEVPSYKSVPNLKRIALFVQKLLGGPKISKLGHVTQATPT